MSDEQSHCGARAPYRKKTNSRGSQSLCRGALRVGGVRLRGSYLLRSAEDDIVSDVDYLLDEIERLTASVNCAFCDTERENGTGTFCEDHVSIEAMRKRQTLEATLE